MPGGTGTLAASSSVGARSSSSTIASLPNPALYLPGQRIISGHANRAVIEVRPFEIEAVIAHIDHDRVIGLAGLFKNFEHPAHFGVNLLNHGVVSCRDLSV